METIIVEIPYKFPSFNEYTNTCRKNAYAGAQMKKKIQKAITPYIIGLPKFEKPVKLAFYWIEGNKRRDYDNICYAKKFILDALVENGKLKDDNRKFVTGFMDEFGVGKEWKVILEFYEMEVELEMRKTLEERVLEYLREEGSITPREAFMVCGSMRLSAIIFNLKKDGYDIETVMETTKNRWGDKVRYARYVLKEEK